MYCDGCGAPVQAGQAFCSRCGKQFVGPVTALPSSTGRVQRHVHLLGILWLALSAFNAIGGVVVYIIANTLFAPGGGTGAPARALGPNRGTRPRLHLAVQYSFRNGDRRLHHVGSSSQPSGTGIRGNGGRSRRLRRRNRSSIMWSSCEDSHPSTSLSSGSPLSRLSGVFQRS